MRVSRARQGHEEEKSNVNERVACVQCACMCTRKVKLKMNIFSPASSGIFSRAKDHDQAGQSNICKQQMCTDDSASSAPRNLLPHFYLCHVGCEVKKGRNNK